MFDFDIGKLMVVAIVALAVIPPKDLPRVMRTVGQFVGKMRRMAAEFQGQFMDAMREADLENVRKELDALNKQANASFDPAAMIRDDVTKAVRQPAEIATSEIALSPPEPHEADLESVRRELETLAEKAKIESASDPSAMIGDDAAKAVQPPAGTGTSEISLGPRDQPPVATHLPTEVPPAKQSAAG